MKPKLAAFPKCYMDELCVNRTMTVGDWIEMGATLGVEGLEFYSGFVEDNEAFLRETKASLQKHGLQMPMLCSSPDFTEPDPDLLAQEIWRERRMIEITAFLGGRFCRVLSGQRRPGLPVETGIAQVVRAIKSLLPFAEKHGVVLSMENHYKDSYWRYRKLPGRNGTYLSQQKDFRRQCRSLLRNGRLLHLPRAPGLPTRLPGRPCDRSFCRTTGRGSTRRESDASG